MPDDSESMYDQVTDEGLDCKVEIDKLENPLRHQGDVYPIRVDIKYKSWPYRDAAYAPITLREAEILVEDLEDAIREIKDAEKAKTKDASK